MNNQNVQSAGLQVKGTPVQMSCVEEEIDHMSDSFLKLSMQLQRRAQTSTWLNERENSAGNQVRASSTSLPSLSRNGTVLLELKRCYVSQRLNELQVTLGQMRRRQQHDNKLKDGTRGCTQSDSHTAQWGEREQYPVGNGCSPTDGQRRYSFSASQNHSQCSAESKGLGSYKLESHISEQQRSCTVQNNPHTSLDYQVSGSHEQLQPGKLKPNSRITVENTTGHTDIDDLWVPIDQKVDLNMDKC